MNSPWFLDGKLCLRLHPKPLGYQTRSGRLQRGSAAAVAARMAPPRWAPIPAAVSAAASFCGIIGIKTSYGASRATGWCLRLFADSVGALARSARTVRSSLRLWLI